jgi:hypothetical protein
MIKIVINVGGLQSAYEGDYHELHRNDWNDIIRLKLDEAEEVRQNIAQDHFNGEKAVA